MNNFYGFKNQTIEHIGQMLEHNQLSVVDGGVLTEFEKTVAKFLGHQYGVAACNGTAAIHLAYFAIGIGVGDEVIIPTYSFHAMVTPLLQLGGKSIFCDINLDALTISVEDAEHKITEKTKAIMVLQPWGNIADVKRLRCLADKHGLVLISDSSHAHGAKWDGKPLGEYFDIICASFGKGKLITGGELGSLTTNDKRIRDRALLYSHPNRVPNAYITDEYRSISNSIGIKYRPHALALRLALDQFEDFDDRNQRLNENVEKLIEVIISAGFHVPQKFESAERNYWKIIVIAETEQIMAIRTLAVQAGLAIEGNHYDPLLHEDSIVTEYYGISQKDFPNAEMFKGRILQIDAMQLYDEAVLEKYIKLFYGVDK